jgi:hypothetical protein
MPTTMPLSKRGATHRREPSRFSAVFYDLQKLGIGQSVFVPTPPDMTHHQMQQRLSPMAVKALGKGNWTSKQDAAAEGLPVSGVRIWRLT